MKYPYIYFLKPSYKSYLLHLSNTVFVFCIAWMQKHKSVRRKKVGHVPAVQMSETVDES